MGGRHEKVESGESARVHEMTRITAKLQDERRALVEENDGLKAQLERA